MSNIKYTPGESVRRVDLHEEYGGRRQGGISPSQVSKNVFIFTDPKTGILHGYLYDGWREDGYFHYTGEGQRGDQRMVQGNRSIRDHAHENRELHVFEVTNGKATYLDQFEYVDDYLADAPESGTDDTRSVIVFRLRPKTVAPGPNRSKVDRLGHEAVKEVPVEQHLTESVLVGPAEQSHEAQRREQKLVQDLFVYLELDGHEVCRLQFLPPGEPAPIFCDLYDKTENVIYEAKGSVARPSIRMAVGQLADYVRLVEPTPSKVILLPERPRPDLLALARSQGIEVTWRSGDGFERTDAS